VWKGLLLCGRRDREKFLLHVSSHPSTAASAAIARMKKAAKK
jgi:protein tyrosine/serine phosphatase